MAINYNCTIFSVLNLSQYFLCSQKGIINFFLEGDFIYTVVYVHNGLNLGINFRSIKTISVFYILCVKHLYKETLY